MSLQPQLEVMSILHLNKLRYDMHGFRLMSSDRIELLHSNQSIAAQDHFTHLSNAYINPMLQYPLLSPMLCTVHDVSVASLGA